MTLLSQFQTWACTKLEDSLSPLPNSSSQYKAPHHLRSLIFAPLAITAVGMNNVGRLLNYLSSYVWTPPTPHPLQDFTAVTKDSRKWALLEGKTDVTFEPSFLFGAATCTYQDSGAESCPHSQWKAWEEKCVPAHNRSGKSASLFPLYQTEEGRTLIIDRLKKLGLNSYRFSIEWSHIEPKMGKFDLKQLAVYVDLCKALRDADISPMVTLHHFSEPLWFHEKGGFEHSENIPDFIKFAQHIFPDLTQDYHKKPLVEWICTINEPNIEAFSRYVFGSFSPGCKVSFSRAGKFLCNALTAHCKVYEVLKTMNSQVKIGIVHQRLSMLSSSVLTAPVTHYINRLVNETVLNFFKTGIFHLKVPFSCHFEELGPKPKTDFIGLQYYTRPIIGLTGSTSYHEPMTQMPFREDPEGLYEAILEVHQAFNVPVVITENGISTHDEKQRERYMQRALYAVHRAREQIGDENLLGYFVWSFCDNSEWDMGRDPQRFGAFALDQEGKLAEEPKTGMKPLIRTALASKNG